MHEIMRSLWKGTVGVGLLVIPVTLGTAVSEDRLPLHRVRRSDGSRIRQKNVAEADGQEVEWSDISSGYETPGGQTVILGKDDFETAYGEKSRDAKILAFTDLPEIPRTAHDTSYYVQPGKGGEKAYELLAEVLKRTGKVAVVSFALRDREAMAVLYTHGDGYLVLERIQWAANVRKPDFEAPRTGITEAEISLAENLVAQLTKPFEWGSYTDSSMAKLEAVIQAKVEGGQVLGTPKAPGQAAPLDLTAALKASVAAAKAAKTPARATRQPRPRKTATAKTQVGEAA